MTAPDYPSFSNLEDNNKKNLTAVEILNPAPVSKWNLYVLIGCSVLAIGLVLLGPWLYPYVEAHIDGFWAQFQ